jgi:hypothetical protein
MRQIQLTEQAYDLAKVRADQAGFPSVDEYVSSIIVDVDYEMIETPNLDYLFTPERLAIIDSSLAEAKAGRFYTSAEVEAHFQKRFTA